MEHRERRLRYSLQARYGITVEQKATLLAAQAFRCALCRGDTPTSKGWMVDHCHTTQAVRGILCHHCHVGLGNFKDNPETLRNAIAYLAGASAPPTT